MIYLESVKIKNYINTIDHGISLKLHDDLVYHISSNDINKIDKIYSLFQNQTNYISGKIFIQEINICELDVNKFTNLIYEKISFCEKSLFFNDQFTLKKYINYYKSFNNHRNLSLDSLLNLFMLNQINLSLNINKLSFYDRLKAKLMCAFLKSTHYIFIKCVDFNRLTDHEKEQFKNILYTISELYNLEILIFDLNNSLKFDLSINLDDQVLYKFNNTLTIYTNEFNSLGYKIYKNKFNIIKYGFINWYKLFLLYIFINFVFLFLSIFILSTLKINPDQNVHQFIRDINNNKIGFSVLGYGLLIFDMVFVLLFNILMFNNYKKYLLNLKHIGVPNMWILLIIPLILILLTLLVILFSFIFNIILYDTQHVIYNMNKVWNDSLYVVLVYIILIFLISYIFIFQINDKLNLNKWNNLEL